MPIIRNDAVEFGPGLFDNTKRRMLVNPDKGSGATTLGKLIVSPGAEIPMHTHRVEETMVITKGMATVVLGDEAYTLEPNDVIFAPAGIKHMLVNRGNESMEFLFFYPAIEVRLDRA